MTSPKTSYRQNAEPHDLQVSEAYIEDMIQRRKQSSPPSETKKNRGHD